MSVFVRHWKISVAGALTALLCFQAGGWFLASGVLQFQAKNAAHFAMQRRETPLEIITIAAASLAEVRVGKKEIRLEGRLYDIKNQRVKGDSVLLELYHDRHEEALLDALGALFAPSGNNDAARVPSLQFWLAKWLGAAFLPPPLPFFKLKQAGFASAVFTCHLPAAQTAPACFSPPPERFFASH